MPKQPKDSLHFFTLLFGVIAILSLASLNLYSFLKEENVLGVTSKVQGVESEILFWENFLLANDSYLDGWFELARLKIDTGDIEGAWTALNRIEEINPNSQELLKLKNSL